MTAVEVVRGLAQVSITARILGPEGFGALAVIVAVSALIHGLLALPGGDTVTTFVTRSVTEGRREEAGAILRLTMVVSQGLSLAGYAVIVVLALTASSLLGISESHVNALLLYGLLGVFLATRSEALAVLRLSDRVNLGLAVTVAATLVSLGLIVLAWRTGGGLSAVVTAYVAAAVVNGVGMFAAAVASARKAGVGGFLSFAVAEGPFGCGKVSVRHVRKNEARNIASKPGFRPDGPVCCCCGRGNLQGSPRDHKHGQTPLWSHTLRGAAGVQQTVVLRAGCRAAAFVSPIHHRVALGGCHCSCIARRASPTHHPPTTRGRVWGSIPTAVDHDPRGFRRQHWCVRYSPSVHRAHFPCCGVDDRESTGIHRRAGVAGSSIWG